MSTQDDSVDLSEYAVHDRVPEREPPLGSFVDADALEEQPLAVEDLGVDQALALRPVRRRLPKLDADRLLNVTTGYPVLLKRLKRVRYEGRGTEKKFLKKYLTQYQLWANRVWPKANVHDFIFLERSASRDAKVKKYRQELMHTEIVEHEQRRQKPEAPPPGGADSGVSYKSSRLVSDWFSKQHAEHAAAGSRKPEDEGASISDDAEGRLQRVPIDSGRRLSLVNDEALLEDTARYATGDACRTLEPTATQAAGNGDRIASILRDNAGDSLSPASPDDIDRSVATRVVGNDAALDIGATDGAETVANLGDVGSPADLDASSLAEEVAEEDENAGIYADLGF